MNRITAGLCRVLVILNCLLIHTAYGAKFSTEIDINDPYNARMVKILGQYDGDRTGYSLAAGDLNGDGYEDMVAGSYTASDGEGVTYVIFGSADFLSNDTMDMDSYPVNVLRIYGKSKVDWSGYSVAVGKINGDNYYDIIIGAHKADPGGRTNAGEVYVIFGASNLHIRGTIDLSGSPSGVVRIYGDNPEDWTGYSVAAGNINNDSYEDLIIGAYKADPLNRNSAGTTYLIFGSVNFQTRGIIDLSGSPSGVVRIHGETAGDMSGYSVAAGDLNGDNVEDVIIGAYGPLEGRGATYVIPGYADIDTLTVLDIDNPPPELMPADDGIVKIFGDDENDHSGAAVSAGDLNNDGFDDLIMGAFGGDPPNGLDAGETNVMFGVSTFFDKGIVYLGSLISNMIRVYGKEMFEESGIAVSVGDLNNDGFDELIIGAHKSSPQGRIYAGTTYIVWGAADLHDRGIIDLNGTPPEVSRMYGKTAEDYSGKAVAAGDLNGDGCKDLFIGACFADPEVRANAGEVYVTGGFQITEVINFSPGENEYVNRDSEIRMFLNSDLDSLYVDVFEKDLLPISGSLYWSVNNATFVPDSLLTPSSWVRVFVNGKNVDGEAIDEEILTFFVKSDEVPPQFITHVPAENEVNVSPTENIVVTFNNDVKPDSTTAVITGVGSRNIAMAKTWSDSVLTLVNNNSFQLSEVIAVTISAGDQYGDRADSTWTFSVRPEIDRPYFTVSQPGNPQHLPKDAYFYITFPLDIDKSAVETLIEGSQSGEISGTWAWSDTIYTFNSSQDYIPGETLNLLITASDIHRNTISDSLFTFTVKPDEIPPSILSRSPEDGEVDVSHVAQIIVEFTEDVVRDSTTIAVTSKNQGSKPISYSWTDYMLTAFATTSFQINDTITVTVNAGDAYANRQEYSWSFVIRPEIQPPSFTVVVPFSASLMSTQDTISLVFPGDVDKSTVETTLVGSLNDPIPGAWEWSDTVYTFTPSPRYTPGYTLTLTVNATDTHKNSIPETIRTFTVKPDETPPSIKAHYPETNEMNVALDQNSIIHFTGDIVPDSTAVEVKSHIRGTLATTKSWLDSTLTLVTTYGFQDNETITITVNAGDLYANRAIYEWSFSTGTELTLSYYEVLVPGDPDLMGKLDPITLIVSDKVNISSLTMSLTGSLSGVLTQSWTSLDSAYTFTPADGYSYGETLTLIVNAYDIYQNPIPETSYTFTVKEDETPPAITYRSPAPDSTNVESDTDIVIGFTADVEIDSTSVTVTGHNQRTVTMAHSWDNSTLTLVNDNSFQLSEVITVTVSAGDIYANRIEESWSFSTKQETDPPYYELITPGNPDLMGTEDTISLIFPSDIDTLTVETVLEGSLSGDVAGEWAWSDTSYTFTPAGYELGETLTLTVNASDIHGNAIPEATHTFTVKSDEIPPSILSHSPLANAVNVDPDAEIVIEFTADAAPDSTTVSVSGSIQGAITMQQSWEDNVLTLSSGQLFSLDEVITVSVNAGDIYANRKEDTWSFTIKSEAEPPYFEVVTPFAPVLMRTGDTIALVFPGDIDKQTVEVVLEGSISGDVAGEWAWSDTTYIFTPAGYEPGETLTLTVNAKDINDNILPETIVTFNVKGDEIPPSIISYSPGEDDINLDPGRDIVIEFSADVCPDSTIVSVTGSSQGVITMDYLWEWNVLTLINNNSFRLDEVITVVVYAGDIFANRMSETWTFRTKVDDVPPELEVVVPGDTDELSINAFISLVFPADIDTSSVVVSLEGSQSGALTVNWAWSDSTYTFTPAEFYKFGENISLTVNAADIYGNTMEEVSRMFTVGENAPWLNITSVELTDSTTHTYRIDYTFDDPDDNYTVTRGWKYSIDGGEWIAIPENYITNNQSIPPGKGSIYLKLPNEFIGVYSKNVRFRMEVFDGRFGSGYRISPPFAVDINQKSTVIVQNVTHNLEAQNIIVSYSISDAEKNTVSLLFEYSYDYGLTWFTGEPEENVSQIPYPLYNGSFTWNYIEELQKGIDYFGFQVRLTPIDYKSGTPGVSDFVNIDLNEPPSLELDDIFTTQSGDVSIKYHITDAENDTISLVCSYSLDNGKTWVETPNVAGTDSILTYDGSLVWYSKKDAPSISSFVVKFRAVPVDHDEGTGDETEVFQLINNGPPDVTVTLPDTVGNIVDIPFHISDPENDPVTVHVMWSRGGGTWAPATVTGDTLNIVESAYIDTLVWNSKTDTGAGFFEELLLKVIVTDEYNPPGSSALNFHELSIVLDNEGPGFVSALGYAYGDTVYFNFTETVIDSTVLDPDRFTLSHGLSVRDVKKGSAGSQYFLLLGENEKLPFDTVTMTVTDVEDIFGNITEETSIEFHTEDDNENPGVSIQDIPEEVTGDVSVYYQISDAESDIVSLTVFYSLDGGKTWGNATVEGTLSNITSSEYSGDFLWKTAIDIQDMDVEGVLLKVMAADLQEGAPAISIPFRVDNNMPPSVVMAVADPDSIFSGKMELFYELGDAENDTLSIGVFYSLDDGVNYEQAAVSGLITSIAPDFYSGKVEWDTETDMSGSFDHVLIKMIPLDNDEGTADSLAVWVDNYGACRVKVTLPEGEQTDDISVVYSITDPNGRDVSLTVEFSIDYGQTWKSAVTEGKISQIGSEQYDGSFTWKSAVQLDGYEGTALLRVIPNNGIDGVTETDEVLFDYNDPPVIALDPIEDEVSDDVTVLYTVTDTERDSVSISIEYSIDDGKNWYEAEISGETTGITADGIKKSIIWQSGKDLPGKEIDNVRIRMSASDIDPGNTAEIGNIHLDNNRTPSVVISVANSDSTYEDYIEVNYILSDTENNMLGFEMLYSTDGGINYLQAKVTGKTSGIFSGGYSSAIRWETLDDLTRYYGEAVIKLLPSDNEAGTPDSLTVRINTIGISSVTLTAPQVEQNDDIQVSYEITDTKNNNVSLAADYSIDEGVTWNPAETVGNITNLSPDAYKDSFVWKAGNDLDGYDGTVRLRVTPDNGAESVSEIAVITVDYNEPPFIEAVLNDMDKVYSGQMEVSFRASDTEKDNLTVNLEYSLDGGETYLKAALSGSAAVTPDVDTEITWLSFDDIGFRNNAEIYLRLTPCDNDPGESYDAGPYTVTNLVGDYTYDLKINGDDLPYFIDIWNNQDTSKEIGPVIGMPPNLSVLPDGKVDFEDLTAFVWMWNWYSGQVSEAGKSVFKPAYHISDDSGLDSGVRFMLSGDGTFTILSEKRPDFMNVFVMSDKNEKIKITVCESEYWSCGDGVFLTRSYIDGKFEIAAARMGDIEEDSNTPCNLGTLRVNSRTGDIRLAYKLRIAGVKEMFEGETVLEKDELFTKPAEYALKQNSPNPFNPATAIRYSLPHDVHVTLTVYTVHGQLIEVLKDEFSPAGEYSVRWDASLFANGIYFYTLKAGNFIETRKMMLVK